MCLPRVLLIAAASVAAPFIAGRTTLAAQEASPYVPIADWTMPYVEYLIATGVVADPTPLTRPLKRGDLLRALREVDTLTVPARAAEVVRRLIAVYTPERHGPSYHVVGNLGVAAATYMRRDPLAAIDSTGPRQAGSSRGTVSGGLDLQFLFERVVAVAHPYFDTRLKYDPDWYGTKTRSIAGRTAESYVSAQWRLAELFFGRLDRNWGPSGIQGLLLSDNPYGLDHLGVEFGTPRFQFQAIATQLDDQLDSAGVNEHRYMAQHRLWIRPNKRWTFAVWEGEVLSGPNRVFEPWYLNIMNLGLLEEINNRARKINSFVGLDLERQGDMTPFAQFMLDDIEIDRKSTTDVKPPSYGLTIGAKGGLGSAPLSWMLFYTQVANLTYRNEDNLEVPLYHFLGTGRNFDDYDQATLKLTFLPRPGLLLEPELTYLRQGQGDPRLPHPLPAAYPTTATIFQGVVERTLRLAASGDYTPSEHLGVSFDAGIHRITNFQHVIGDTRTQFIGSIGVTYRFVMAGALP